MSIFTTSDNVSGLLPEDYGALVVRPVEELSVALRVSTIVATERNTYRIPIVTEDGSAAWYTEGQDLTGDGPTFDEIEVTPAKVGRVVLVSTELADDSTPEASGEVGRSIARAISTEIDKAYFGDLAAPAPKGLAAAAAVPAVSGAWGNTDVFAHAMSIAEAAGGRIRFFVTSPADMLTLLMVKKQEGSNEPLLGQDPTQPAVRTILGATLLASPAVAQGTIWAIDPEFSRVVLRKDVTIETSRESHFTTDQVAVKAVMRVGFAFPHPKALVKITETP